MARARNLKPGFFTNGDLLECRPLARLLYAGLWCEADRRGILEDRPKTLKVKILPGDDCDIEELLTELCDRGFIRRYEARGIRCICIPTFDKHQNPHVKEQASTLPTPDEIGKPDASPVLAPDKHSASPAESLLPITESLLPITPTTVGDGADAPNEPKPKPEPKPKATRIKDDWKPSPGFAAWARDNDFSEFEIAAELPKFRDHHRQKGTLGQDWDAGFRNWMRRSREIAAAAPLKPANGRHPPLPNVLQPGAVPKDGGLADYKRLYGGGSTAREAS